VNVASRAIGIRSGEGRTVGLLVATMSVSMAGIAIGESGIDALFFDRIGTHALPLMYLAQAASTLVGMLALTTVLGRVPHRMIYVWSPVLLALAILAERAVVATRVSWIYPVMWITVAFAMLAQAIGLWGTAGTVVDTHQAKRLFPIFGAGGILGSVVGGLLTRPLVALVGAENLLLVWAGCLVAAFVLCRLVLGPSAAADTARKPRSASALGDLKAGLGYVRRSRLLVAMAAAAVLFSVLFYSLFLPFATVAAARFPDADALAGFFGLVWAVITGVAFLISFLLTNRLFAWFGVVVMILVLPTLYTGSFGILLVESGFVTLVALRISTGIWLQGVASPAWETLVNVVPDDRRDQVRAFLNGGPAQAGTAIAGAVALVGQDVLSPRAFAAIGLLASVLTLVAAFAIRRSYLDALLEALRAGRPQVFDKPTTWTPMPLQADAETGRVLAGSMGSDDVRMRRLAYQLAAGLADVPVADAVIRGVEDPDAIVRLGAVRALDATGQAGRTALLRAIDDADAGVAAAASARSLGSGDERAARARLRLAQLLGDSDERVRAVALDQLSGASGEEAADLVEGLLEDPSADVRAAALERLAASAPERARAPALRSMADPDPRVRRAAGRALGSSGEGALEEVLGALGDPRMTDAGIEAARLVHADGHAAQIRAFVRRVAERVVEDREVASAIPAEGEAEELLRDALVERDRRAARCGLWAAAMLAPRREAAATAIENLDGPADQRARALETLESAGEPDLVRPLLSAWEPMGTTADLDWLGRTLDDDDPVVRRCAELVRARREGDPMPGTVTIPLMERVLFLRKVSLFADLGPRDLERVAEIAEERGYADGESIAVEGERGEELHIVVEGVIRVIRNGDGGVRELARRGPGDVVGEMSLLTRSPRIASLVAEGVVRTIRIGDREFESMLRERPDVALGVMRVLAQRLAEGATEPSHAG
jgi:hypothetical protein